MLIYIVLPGLIVFYNCVFLNKKILYNRKYFLLSSFLTMAVIVGLRGIETGEDTSHFLQVFDLVNEADWKTVLTSFGGFKISVWGETVEYLYAVLNKVVSVFTNEGQVLLIVVSLITMLLFARFIYINIPQHVFLATMVFLCNGLFMAAFNGIRELLAVAVIINSYEFFKKKDYISAGLITATAFFIHMSSIMMLPFFIFIPRIRNYRKGTIYITLICALMIAAVPIIPKILTLVFPKYSAYFIEHFWDNSYRGVIIIWFVELALSVYIYHDHIQNEGAFLGIIGTLIYITLAVISTQLWAFSRAMTYFEPFSMMIFSYGSEKFKPSSRKYYYAAFMLIMLLEYISYATSSTRIYTFFWNN